MKKLKKSKIPKGYVLGGDIQEMQPVDPNKVVKPRQYSSRVQDYVADALTASIDNPLSTIGLGNVIQSKNYNTQVGAETANQVNNGVMKIGPGIAGAFLNYIAPGTGTAVIAGTKALEGAGGKDSGLNAKDSANQEKAGLAINAIAGGVGGIKGKVNGNQKATIDSQTVKNNTPTTSAVDMNNPVAPAASVNGSPDSYQNATGKELINQENALQYDADGNLISYGKKKGGIIGAVDGMKNGGGITPAKAGIILHEGVANGHKITDKQRKFFGWKSHEGMAEGGKVEGAGTAKSDSIDAKVDNGGFVVPAENEKKAQYIRLKYLNTPVKKADLKDGNTPVKLSNGEHYFTPQEVIQLKAQGVNLDKLAPNAEDGMEKADGGYTVDPSGVLSGIQIGTGLYGASKLGSVPVDKLDPQYTDAGNRLQMESQYGLSPLALSLGQENIERNRRAGKADAVYGGGDLQTIQAGASTASMAADRANNELLVQSDQLKNAKLNNYANWVTGKQQLARQLFEDKLGRFNKEENVYGGVMQKGISGLVEGDRFNKVMEAQNQREKLAKAQPYMTGNVQFTQAGIKALADVEGKTPEEYMAGKKIYQGVDFNTLPKQD